MCFGSRVDVETYSGSFIIVSGMGSAKYHRSNTPHETLEAIRGRGQIGMEGLKPSFSDR